MTKSLRKKKSSILRRQHSLLKDTSENFSFFVFAVVSYSFLPFFLSRHSVLSLCHYLHWNDTNYFLFLLSMNHTDFSTISQQFHADAEGEDHKEETNLDIFFRLSWIKSIEKWKISSLSWWIIALLGEDISYTIHIFLIPLLLLLLFVCFFYFQYWCNLLNTCIIKCFITI